MGYVTKQVNFHSPFSSEGETLTQLYQVAVVWKSAVKATSKNRFPF